MAKQKPHTSEQITSLMAELKTQTDRGAAVIASAFLEELTHLMILARLIELSSERQEALFGRSGAPLSSFSAKIELAFALGIVTNDARLALHLIRDVRNKFAHRIEPMTFDHPDIVQIIETRAPKSVKTLDLSTKDRFLSTFHAMALLVYSTAYAGIRLKPLEETHVDFFLQMAVQVAQVYGKEFPKQR